jgi:hypothetical protein
MPKVFIVCEPTVRLNGEFVQAVDLTPALEWGEPVVLLQQQQSFIAPTMTTHTLQNKLANFSEDDYLVPIGDPALMCVAAMVAGSFNNGRVKMLKWDRKIKKYFPVQVDINRKE